MRPIRPEDIALPDTQPIDVTEYLREITSDSLSSQPCRSSDQATNRMHEESI